MHAVTVAALILLLIAVPVAASPTTLSFVVEVAAGTLAAAVPFYAALYRTSETPPTPWAPRSTEPAIEDILLGIAAPPLMAGATVVCVGRLFGVTGKLTGLASILGASVAEVFALRAWELGLPQWMKVIAVPVITSLGATMAFHRQAQSSP